MCAAPHPLTGRQRLRNIRTRFRIIAARQMRAFMTGRIPVAECIGDMEDRAIEAEFDRVYAMGLAAGRTPPGQDEPLGEQIVRLLDACDNRYSALRLVEPLVDAVDARYAELRPRGFFHAHRVARAEAVAALIARGGNLPPTPVFRDEDEPTPSTADQGRHHA